MKSVDRRLDFSTRRLSRSEWRLLGAIAIERELTRSLIMKLAGTLGVLEAARPRASAAGSLGPKSRSERPSAPGTLPLLDEWRENGLVLEIGEGRGGPFGRSSDPSFAVHPEFRELVARRVARDGDLALVADATRVLLGERSFGVSALLLQTGQIDEFQRHAFLVARAAGRLSAPVEADTLVFEAIARPFDADWFTTTFRENALRAAHQVLRGALTSCDECDELFNWAVAELERARSEASDELGEPASGSSAPSLRATLAEHAVLRGRLELAEACAEGLPPGQRWVVDAATRFQSADLSGSRQLLEQWQGSKAPTPDAGALLPLLVLISYGRGSPAAAADAKRLSQSRGADPSRGGGERALRTFFRYASQPESEHPRLDVHQLGRGVGAWELFVLGLTAHLYTKHEVTRAAWAVRLVREGASWIEAGYSWLGRQ
ncbi:MAG TPA: hypothetical protein VNN80_02440, partial [Polyangiaceae bacterium]|nr:hypothetical protein [Polyangiaceae bacterium]